MRLGNFEDFNRLANRSSEVAWNKENLFSNICMFTLTELKAILEDVLISWK